MRHDQPEDRRSRSAAVERTELDDSTSEFIAFFAIHVGGVRSLVRHRLRCEADVEDACADVFALALTKFDEVRALPEGRARRWLLRTAELFCFRQYRNGARFERVIARLSHRAAWAVDPLDDIVGAETTAAVATRVRSVLEHLPEDVARILELDALGELSGPMIAETLGISPGAARLRLMRARRDFRDAYVRLDTPTGLGARS